MIINHYLKLVQFLWKKPGEQITVLGALKSKK